MDKELQDNLKLVAEYDGWVPDVPNHLGEMMYYQKTKPHTVLADMKYHTSWDWQNEVWVKLWGETFESVEYAKSYHDAIDDGNKEAAFKIICDILKRIKA